MRHLLATATAIALPFAAVAEAPQYSLTVYSAAAPGAIDVQALANYGQNLPGYALVRDRRRLTLPRGAGEVRVTDVARRIDPTTVGFESLTDPAGTRVIEQNFQFDLVDQAKLIERYLGETITVEQQRGEQFEAISGTLLSARGGLILERPGGEVLTLTNWSGVRFPRLPGGLITRPTLVWNVLAARGGAHDVRIVYQTQGMTWWTDYNLTLAGEADACRIDLSAWVTLVNQSGASYPGAELKLVAGEVNRAPAAPRPAMMAMEAKAMADGADGFRESSLYEYHLYTLGRPTDLPDNASKQIELFPAVDGASCKRELVFSAAPAPWAHYGAPLLDQGYGATGAGTVGAYVEFENREANRLGLPLPAGRVRVNQANAEDGSLEFIGEDLIKHTPRNEIVRLRLGNAFDVVGERKQLAFAYDDAADTITESFEISVRNRKREATRVTVREYLYRWSAWQVTASNAEYLKRDAQTIDFPLRLAADGEATVRYTVVYRW